MKTIAYNLTMKGAKTFGMWVIDLTAWFIATGYFLMFPSRVLVSIRFYRSIFPAKKYMTCFMYAWKQFHNFSRLFVDRLFVLNRNDISYTSSGWDYIREAQDKGTGGIILMSHLGNWEVAAHLLSGKGLKLMIYMGAVGKKLLERIQKDKLKESGIRIVAVEENSDSPFDAIEGINFLKEGGLVSLTGDRAWGRNKRTIPVKFLGYEAFLPDTPHVFALLSGAPLFIFFSFRTGKKKYHFQATEPIYIKAESRQDRKRALQESAQRYADILGEIVLAHPLEWYNFEQFLGRKLDL